MSGGALSIDCFVCEKHARGGDVPGGVIYDDGLVYAGHTHPLETDDVPLGYLMVEPRRHAAGLGDLTDEEAAHIGVVTNRLGRALREVTDAEHVYSFVVGDSVPHLHVHLAPAGGAAGRGGGCRDRRATRSAEASNQTSSAVMRAVRIGPPSRRRRAPPSGVPGAVVVTSSRRGRADFSGP